MECPNCHNKGNLLGKTFSNLDRKNGIKYCMYCGTKIQISYRWGRIALLFLSIIILVMAINYALVYVLYLPGLHPVLTGGITAILLLFFMQNKFFVNINIIKNNDSIKK